jgi:uncharacterized protein YbbK (DUF523 family)
MSSHVDSEKPALDESRETNSSTTIRPRLAVSACLLGQPVRYDGRDKNCTDLQSLAEWAELVPVCPEVGMGLPVPRPPIEVWRSAQGLRLRQVDDHAVDLTERMRDWFAHNLNRWREMDGFVLKSRSPSCGSNSTPVMAAGDQPVTMGDGLFVTLLRQHFPGIPIIDEETLHDQTLRQDFLQQARHHALGRNRHS